jgi:GTP-binding protein
MELRNIAIIAHVDHGKTTLVDGLLKQSKTFRENEAEMGQELIMDSNDQERERGITILAKNTAVTYKDVKINIVDTPGHADFSGEVERTLNMADGAILLVDAQEGPMPQTKFVLRKALELGLKIIVLVNKIDKKDAIIDKTLSRVYDLFLELATTEAQLDFPVLYAIGRDGKAWDSLPADMNAPGDLTPIFEAILKYFPAPVVDIDGPFQMLVSSLDWDSYKGKYAVGRMHRGKLSTGSEVVIMKANGSSEKIKVDKVFVNQGLKRVEVPEIYSGDIVAITGVKNVDIGDTLADAINPEALPTIQISEPTLSISIGPNTSPFMGKEGSLLTGRQIVERIEKELQTNVAMRFNIEGGQYILSGRGELHICVFLETLSREGFELEIGKPRVITKMVNGVEMEPVEEYTIDVPTEFVGAITSEMGKRNALMISQTEDTPGQTRLVFEVPTRSILGLRSVILTLSKGTGVANSNFLRYDKVSGDSRKIRKGVLIAFETGKASAYGMNSAQERGPLFIEPGTMVYAGMIIGINARDIDLEVNVAKTKHLTNMRSKGEDGIILAAPIKMTLEQCFGFIEDDELLEITPQNLRMRKKLLDAGARMKAARKG